jgi:hypothetical protein
LVKTAELQLTEKQARMLMHSLKTAELAYSNDGKYKAAIEVDKLHEYIYRELFTYGQIDEEN